MFCRSITMSCYFQAVRVIMHMVTRGSCQINTTKVILDVWTSIANNQQWENYPQTWKKNKWTQLILNKQTVLYYLCSIHNGYLVLQQQWKQMRVNNLFVWWLMREYKCLFVLLIEGTLKIGLTAIILMARDITHWPIDIGLCEYR